MSARKYPLDPLVKLRARKVEDQTRALAGAVQARHAAESKREEAVEARAQADDAAAKERARERSALEEGELRAGDLQRAQTWELGVTEERKRLTQRVTRAAESEDAAKKDEAKARDDLAARRADADVVDKDKSRFVARENQRELAKEEEAAAEALRGNERAWRLRRD